MGTKKTAWQEYKAKLTAEGDDAIDGAFADAGGEKKCAKSDGAPEDANVVKKTGIADIAACKAEADDLPEVVAVQFKTGGECLLISGFDAIEGDDTDATGYACHIVKDQTNRIAKAKAYADAVKADEDAYKDLDGAIATFEAAEEVAAE